jgi:GTP-binding protein
LKITAEFVTSAVGATGMPTNQTPQLAIVGRSNVGKSRLINALTRQSVARTSAAPGKTRLANVYLIRRGSHPPLYLVDLPGYGYARGGNRQFGPFVEQFFGGAGRLAGALLLVDSRHPGLESDQQAWSWLTTVVDRVAIVATKIDKLARGERIRALRQFESVFDVTVLPVSAVTGEGLDDLWNLIDRLTTQTTSSRPSSPPGKAKGTAASARKPTNPVRRRSSASTSRR